MTRLELLSRIAPRMQLIETATERGCAVLHRKGITPTNDAVAAWVERHPEATLTRTLIGRPKFNAYMYAEGEEWRQWDLRPYGMLRDCLANIRELEASLAELYLTPQIDDFHFAAASFYACLAGMRADVTELWFKVRESYLDPKRLP
ncbi:hypothetical protein UFOVP783_2 [uncultured Caudovirales phage]|uniref:Uncharacterized protein n=1 Tax=uncultured Caudovirales phage TaxID=2100421 RepID=A0A6J5NSB9_9CAUD|nr:hypothetical protein UFOVP783_2 [uncultured Caudovirales phage]